MDSFYVFKTAGLHSYDCFDIYQGFHAIYLKLKTLEKYWVLNV